VRSLRGTCPTLTFVANGTTVVTDGRTQSSGGNCKHVEDGGRVIVAGQQSAGRVNADRIDIKKRN
jgi:hypothetical protein